MYSHDIKYNSVKMQNSEIKNKIKNVLDELDEMPYGIEKHHKTLSPSKHHYRIKVEKLIEHLLKISNENIMVNIGEICSIRDNQLRELLVKKDDSFERHGVHEGMEGINKLLHMHIDYLLEKM